MWDAQEKAADPSKVPNHYIPIPEYYTREDAMVRTLSSPANKQQFSSRWFSLDKVV